jgi:hypothetical protein
LLSEAFPKLQFWENNLDFSIVSFPVILFLQKNNINIHSEKINCAVLTLFFVFPLAGQLVLNIGGKSMGEYFAFL